MDHIAASEKLKLEADIQNQGITPDDPEWHFEHQYYDYRVEFLLPRFFRGPFLVSLFAVYEVSVTEIARLLQKAQSLEISIGDLRGEDFCGRAKKYYKHILNFELCTDNSAWQQIKMLSEIRNAIAHTNGRVEMLRKSAKSKITELQQKRIGIDTNYGYIVIDRIFVENTFIKVSSSLKDLVQRYKQWDEDHKTV